MTNRGENTILSRQTLVESGLFEYNDPLEYGAPGGLLIVIVGPTAVGKTAAAMEVARRIGGEIISAGTRCRCTEVWTSVPPKPTQDERERVRFHLIDIASPEQQITVSDWKRLAEAAIAEIRRRGKVPIVCGGTGLYIRALLDDWQLAETPADPALRSRLRITAAEGPQALHRELAEVDAQSAARLHPNDSVRIVRALEVYHATGVPISELQRTDRARASHLPAHRFGLTLPATGAVRPHRGACGSDAARGVRARGSRTAQPGGFA